MNFNINLLLYFDTNEPVLAILNAQSASNCNCSTTLSPLSLLTLVFRPKYSVLSKQNCPFVHRGFKALKKLGKGLI